MSLTFRHFFTSTMEKGVHELGADMPELNMSDPVLFCKFVTKQGKSITSLHADIPPCLNRTCLNLSVLNISDPVLFCKFVTKGSSCPVVQLCA